MGPSPQLATSSKLLPAKGEAIPGQVCHPPVLDSIVYLGKESMNSRNNVKMDSLGKSLLTW